MTTFDFRNHATEVLATLKSATGKTRSLQDAATGLRHHLVEEYDGPEPLRDLAALLLEARQQALIQDRLNMDRQQLHHGNLDHEDRVAIGHHYEALRREACAYNHRIRNFIENNAHGHLHEAFSREEFTRWLATAAGGRGAWAEGEVTGATSEIALHAALSGLPRLESVRYATLDEDLLGYDFVAGWNRDIVTIDAKTGRFGPHVERLRGHRHIEVYVDRSFVNGFSVTHAGLKALRRLAEYGLAQSTGEHPHGIPFHRQIAFGRD